MNLMIKNQISAFFFSLTIASAVLAVEQNPCHESTKYLVIERSTGNVGTDFLIKYKSKATDSVSCNYFVTKRDFEIKNEWAEYFLDQQGDLLILDSGTAPPPRGLIIWDLKKRKKVFTGSNSVPYEIKPGYMVFWTETEKATDENCPNRKQWESDGLGAAIETRVTLKLSDFSMHYSSETRCDARE
jgi:hypothetical protein